MKFKRHLISLLLMTVCAAMYSLGISLFLNPNGLAPGGVSGIAIIVNRLTGTGTGLLILFINTPLLLAGLRYLGRDFLVKTVYVTVFSSFLIDLWPRVLPAWIPLTEDKLLASVAGGVLLAVGMGGIFRCGGTTGGTDIVIKLLRRRFKALKTGNIFLIVDSLIILASVFVSHNVEDALYAAISLYITTRLLDVILYGTDEAKLLIIMSDRFAEISAALMSELDVGVTFAEGEGAYTGETKRIILCVVKKTSYHRAKDIVHRIDSRAFMIVSDSKEVIGEGYKPHGAEEL